jgi:hypothetical protein
MIPLPTTILNAFRRKVFLSPRENGRHKKAGASNYLGHGLGERANAAAVSLVHQTDTLVPRYSMEASMRESDRDLIPKKAGKDAIEIETKDQPDDEVTTEENILKSTAGKEAPAENNAAAPFSVFPRTQKRWIIFLVAFAGMFSPMSSFIYYPAISSIADDLRVSVESVNLTVTSYMIVSGIVPAIMGNLADTLGRRPVYMVVFSIYILANIGLAIQRSFPALFALRMLQSAGSSGWFVYFCDTRLDHRAKLRSRDRNDITWVWSDCGHRHPCREGVLCRSGSSWVRTSRDSFIVLIT